MSAATATVASTGSTIRVKHRAAWCAVPEALLQDARLGHAAARLGAWMAGRPDGWETHKGHAMRVLHLGEAAWDRAMRELRAAGYLTTQPKRVGGRWAGQDYDFDPEPPRAPASEAAA